MPNSLTEPIGILAGAPGLVVEIKGYRREDAKEKKAAMETFWIPGVNRLGSCGRWASAEFTDAYAMQQEFEAKAEALAAGSSREAHRLTPPR